jgi:hypothetical protein
MMTLGAQSNSFERNPTRGSFPYMLKEQLTIYSISALKRRQFRIRLGENLFTWPHWCGHSITKIPSNGAHWGYWPGHG